jgi:membrane protease YdiL (CAAX protease family)
MLARPGVVAALVTGAVLIAGNVLAALRSAEAAEGSAFTNWLLAPAILGVAYLLGIRRAEAGLVPGPPRDVLIGIAAGAALAAPAAIAFVLAPLVLGDTVEYAGTSDTALEALGLAVVFLFATALPEELIFRGALHGLWERTSGTSTAVLATSIAFGLWHVVVVFATAEGSGITGHKVLVLLLYVGLLVSLSVAGIVFGLLRVHTSSIVSPVAAHWAAVVILRLGLWAGE